MNAAIIAIAQSADGYLWLATADDLVRFDGVRAVPWQPPGGESLVRGPIHACSPRAMARSGLARTRDSSTGTVNGSCRMSARPVN